MIETDIKNLEKSNIDNKKIIEYLENRIIKLENTFDRLSKKGTLENTKQKEVDDNETSGKSTLALDLNKYDRIRLCEFDFKVIEIYIKAHNIELGSGHARLLTGFLNFYKFKVENGL